jgi:hypothetical protein
VTELTPPQIEVLRAAYRERLYKTGDDYWLPGGETVEAADVEALIRDGLVHVDFAVGIMAPGGPTFLVRISKAGKGAFRDSEMARHDAETQRCTTSPEGKR